MHLFYWAILGLAAFIAIWFLFVVPAERRHHERKLEMIRKRIEKRQVQEDEDNVGSSTDPGSETEEP